MRPFGLAAGLVPKSPSRLAEAGNPGWSEIVSSQARQTGLARRRSPTYARHVCTNSHLDIMRAPVLHVFSSYSPIPASPLSCCDHLACIRLSKLQTGNGELEEVARGGAGRQARQTLCWTSCLARGCIDQQRLAWALGFTHGSRLVDAAPFQLQDRPRKCSSNGALGPHAQPSCRGAGSRPAPPQPSSTRVELKPSISPGAAASS